MVAANSGYFQPPFKFWSIWNDRVVVGCAIHASPDGLVVSEAPSDAAGALFQAIRDEGLNPRRIFGGPEFISELASHFEHSDLKPHTAISWTLARLDSVAETLGAPSGSARLASAEDEGIVRRWAEAYQAEKPAFLDIGAFMSRKLEDKSLFLFDSLGATRSMLTISGASRNGARISSVFTPDAERGKGFATSLVAQVSQALLDDGCRFVILNWSDGSPAQRIYKKIGFYPVATLKSLMINGGSYSRHNDIALSSCSSK